MSHGVTNSFIGAFRYRGTLKNVSLLEDTLKQLSNLNPAQNQCKQDPKTQNDP